MNPIVVDTGGLTDRGSVRPENQDQFFIGQLARGIRLHSTSLKVEPNSVLLGDGTGHLFMVADGMGGHQGGEEASRIAIEYFMTAILNRPQWNSLIARYGEDHQLRDELGAILNEAHQEIRRRSEADVSLAGMGTTFTMAYVMWPIMLVVHAGDTRCYLLRQGKLDLLTSDHTIANRMLQTGRLKAGPSERSPWANVLYNALGAGSDGVQADIYARLLDSDDAILMCSDGLNKHVDDATIERVLNESNNMQQACDTLVQLAKQGGGTDNVTVVAAQWRSATVDPIMRVTATAPAEERCVSELPNPMREVTTIPGTSTIPAGPLDDLSGDTDPMATEQF